jgi:hypothetical protein
MRQEAMQAAGICAEEAARIYIVAEMNACQRLQTALMPRRAWRWAKNCGFHRRDEQCTYN